MISSKAVFLSIFGEVHSKKPPKGYVLFEQEGMIVVAYLFWLEWYAQLYQISLAFELEIIGSQ